MILQRPNLDPRVRDDLRAQRALLTIESTTPQWRIEQIQKYRGYGSYEEMYYNTGMYSH